MSKIKNYLSLIKFSHTIFAMPFALIGYFLGIWWYKLYPIQILNDIKEGRDVLYTDDGSALLLKFVLVVFCMIFARSAAMAFNRYLDRRFDALNPRTAIREVPKGIITPQNALIFTIVNCILFIISTYFINPICFYLSPVALAIVLGYSYTKRFTPLCHLILGVRTFACSNRCIFSCNRSVSFFTHTFFTGRNFLGEWV